MKKLSKEDQYFLEMFNNEMDYLSKDDRYKHYKPFTVPLLFSIRSSLRVIIALLGFLCGCEIAKLL